MRQLDRYRRGGSPRRANRGVGVFPPLPFVGGDQPREINRRFAPTATNFKTPERVFIDLDATGQREVTGARD